MDITRLGKIIVTTILVVTYLYLAMFGAMLSFAALIRATSSFYYDTLTELVLSMIGIILFYGMIRAIVSLVKKNKKQVLKWKHNRLIVAIIISLTIFFLDSFGLFRSMPIVIKIVLTGGFQIANFFNSVIANIFVEKFGLDFIRAFFSPINWLFGMVYWVLILGWFWPEKRGKKVE